jgi:hypothetical protein
VPVESRDGHAASSPDSVDLLLFEVRDAVENSMLGGRDRAIISVPIAGRQL